MECILKLVGAGPGDPELITLKAVKAISQAEVILFDALVNESLLEHASPNCIKKYVGKRFGCHTLSQQEINFLVIEFSKTYKNIVRLKGGDPFVFGRALEEIESANRHGIQVEIIPGISSAIAVPASQMIPLTARGIHGSFWVTTGTTQSGKISEDIKLAAQSSATIIILMAVSKLQEIMEIFIGYGKGEISVAIIQDGTTPKARMITGTAKDIYCKAQRAELNNPAIIVVGDVVRLKPSLVQDVANENLFPEQYF